MISIYDYVLRMYRINDKVQNFMLLSNFSIFLSNKL